VEIIILAGIVYLIFKSGFLRGIASLYRQTEVVTLINHLLRPHFDVGFFTGDPGEFSRLSFQKAWHEADRIFDGHLGPRPHKLSITAYTLALASAELAHRNDDNAHAVLFVLGAMLSAIKDNKDQHNFVDADFELIKYSMRAYTALALKDEAKSDKLSAELEAFGYIE
jgi:hypothetical protein